MCSVTLPTIMTPVDGPADDGGQQEEPKAAKRKMSLSTCGVCGSEEAKYRCPACLTHSCSLPCVKKHKDASSCSGVRDKAAFVALSHFDEMNLLSDYRFLEDTGRFADGANRDNLIRAPRATMKAKKLAANARKMNITLRFLPCTFTKSRENSTFFLTAEKEFLWHLKLMFPQSSTEFSQRRVSDKLTLEQILTPYIHPAESDPVTRQKLKMYAQAPLDHVRVFMKAEGRKANSVRYHKLSMEKSLRDNLSYKILIEYPTLHVVLRDHWEDYPLKGPAEPASARASFAANGEGAAAAAEGPARLSSPSPSPQGPQAAGGADIWTADPDTSPECESPQKKRAKREPGEDELEEGEILDSDEEEQQEEEEESTENPALDKRRECYGDIQGAQVEGSDTAVDSAPVDGSGGVTEEAAEVSASVEAAPKEPGPPLESVSADSVGCSEPQ